VPVAACEDDEVVVAGVASVCPDVSIMGDFGAAVAGAAAVADKGGETVVAGVAFACPEVAINGDDEAVVVAGVASADPDVEAVPISTGWLRDPDAIAEAEAGGTAAGGKGLQIGASAKEMHKIAKPSSHVSPKTASLRAIDAPRGFLDIWSTLLI
jgi:hypothetical protein